VITGEGFKLTLGSRPATNKRPVATVETPTGSAGSASVEILQPPTASFRGTCDVAWQTTELHAFTKKPTVATDTPPVIGLSPTSPTYRSPDLSLDPPAEA
jgi:hypothetical protein